MSQQNHCVYEFGPFHLDATKRVLLKEGEPLKLFPKEFDTLLALVQHSGELLEKDDLMRTVWHDAIVEESNIATNISHLRKILGESRDKHDYIVTVPGRGYRFVAGVRQSFDEMIVRERTRVTVEEQAEEESKLPVKEATHDGKGRRRRLVFAGIAVVLAAVAFGSYRFIRQRSSQNAAAIPFRTIELIKLTNSGRATLAAMSPDGRYIVHVSKDTQGESLWLKQVATQSNVQIVAPASISYWGLTFSPDGEYIYCVTAESNKGDTTLTLIPVLGGPARRLPVGPHGPVGFSPDGQRFAFINARRDESYLYAADANGNGAHLIAKRGPPEKFIDIAVGPSWSPNGEEIAVAVRRYDQEGYFNNVVAISVADGTERSLTTRRWSAVGQLAWLPNNAGLVMVARESASTPFQVWHLPLAGSDARRMTNDLNNYRGVSYNQRTGAFLAVQTNVVSGIWVVPFNGLSDRRVEHTDFAIDGNSATQLVSASGRIQDVAWMPDGRLLYVFPAADGSEVWMWDEVAHAPKQVTSGARNFHGLAVSPDGRYLVFASDRSGTFSLWRVEMNGGEPVQLTNGEGEVSPRFSPDGQWIVYEKGFPTAANIWRLPTGGGEPVALTENRGQRPDVSPDGKLIAYHTLDSESQTPTWLFGVMSLDGVRMLKMFTFAPTVENRIVRWLPGGAGLVYVDSTSAGSNFWVQPLENGAPQQLSDFKEKHIEAFDFSHDGRKVAFVNAIETSDVVLIEAK